MWLRLYCDILDDPKVQKLSGDDFKAWINLLVLAKEGGGLLPPIEDIAFKLRTTEENATRLTEELVKRGLLDSDGKDITPHNWDGRQYEGSSSTERVRRYRAGNDEMHKSGKIKYVYFIGTSMDGTVKIGISKNPWARLNDLQCESPDELSILATFRADTYSEVVLHHLLAEFRKYGEWFALPEYVQFEVVEAAANKEDYAQLLHRLRSKTTVAATTELRTEADTET